MSSSYGKKFKVSELCYFLNMASFNLTGGTLGMTKEQIALFFFYQRYYKILFKKGCVTMLLK